MGKSVEREGFLGKYTEHFDDNGNKVGESRERDGFLGKYTEHTDISGNKTGESRDREGFFGGYTEHTDTSGKKSGESRDRDGFFGDYTEHTDTSGRKTGESREREGFFGTYTEHTGSGWYGAKKKEPSNQSGRASNGSTTGSSASNGSSTYDSSSGSYSSSASSSERGLLKFVLGAILLVWLISMCNSIGNKVQVPAEQNLLHVAPASKIKRQKTIKHESAVPQAMPNQEENASVEDSKILTEQEHQDEIRQKELATQSQIEATEQWQPSPYCENILKQCGGKPNEVECIHVRYINSQSSCQGSCAEAMNMNLRNLGFDVNVQRWWSMEAASGSAGCVGYRPDIGGSIEGAKCLARILGPQYQVGECNSDGFPYNVRLH